MTLEGVLRLSLTVAGLVVMFALIAACGSGNDAGGGPGISIATVTPAATGTQPGGPGQATPLPAETAEMEGTSAAIPEPVATESPVSALPPTPETTVDEVLSGFVYPIVGGCLPQGDQLMPNAPRPYRQGTHEGVDFYNVDNCTPIGAGTPVVAAKAGRIVRIDHDYMNPTPEEMNALLADPVSETALDRFRGQQVWIDHGAGVVTRYCHLSGVAAGLQAGDFVEQGTTIGYVGDSGTPTSVFGGGGEDHLHWEVRVGDSYLGAGQDAATVRALYRALFES